MGRRWWCAAALVLAGLAFGAGAATSPVYKHVTFSVLEDYDKGDDLADVGRDFDLMRQLGVRVWRGSFGWDDYEPERGRFDFAWLHQFVALAASRGITLRPYLGYTPAWAAGGPDKDGQAWNQPPRHEEDWRAFVEAMAAELRHHSNVPSLEIYNEENVAQWWEGSRDDYARTLATASRAARRARHFEILPGGLVFPDVQWMRDLCGHPGEGRQFDIVAVHAYPETWTPPDVTVENYLGTWFDSGFAGAVDRACGRKRIWVNETGFATVPGKTERDQAAWWMRAAATFAAEPRVEQIGIYEIKDLAAGKAVIGDAPNYHLGITRVDRTPKLAFHTLERLVALFAQDVTILPADAIGVEALDAAGEPHHQAFCRPDGLCFAFLWNRTADQRVRVRLGASAANATEYALDGSASPLAPPVLLDLPLARGVPRLVSWRRGSRF